MSEDKEMETSESVQCRLDNWADVPTNSKISKHVVSGVKILRNSSIEDVYDNSDKFDGKILLASWEYPYSRQFIHLYLTKDPPF